MEHKDFTTCHLRQLKAIRLMCYECMGYNLMEIKNCTSPKCSLFPYKDGHLASNNSKQIGFEEGIIVNKREE